MPIHSFLAYLGLHGHNGNRMELWQQLIPWKSISSSNEWEADRRLVLIHDKWRKPTDRGSRKHLLEVCFTKPADTKIPSTQPCAKLIYSPCLSAQGWAEIECSDTTDSLCWAQCHCPNASSVSQRLYQQCLMSRQTSFWYHDICPTFQYLHSYSLPPKDQTKCGRSPQKGG